MTNARYTFAGFELDVAERRLTRDGSTVSIAERHFDVLRHLVAHAGTVASKNDLVQLAWPDVAVTDNSLEHAISVLRRTLGSSADGAPLIQTVPRQGYRFVAPVAQAGATRTEQHLDDLLVPHRAWLHGRAALETLTRNDVASAIAAFRQVLAREPEYAPAHVGLANALALQFQSTRADPSPDVSALQTALVHARTACRLDEAWAEAWATLAFVLQSARQPDEAVAAARRATMLEPDNWRHLLRLAFASWGEDRLRAARRTQMLLPSLGLAHWLAATVLVARQAFDAAEEELDRGAAAQDAQEGGRFAAVGLHWLRGLVRLRRGDEDGARASFARELQFGRSGHVYARECSANVWYALAALEQRADDRRAAADALAQALERVERHPLALAAAGSEVDARDGVDAAHARAVKAVAAGSHVSAAADVLDALRAAPPGAAGWTIPVDPWLQCARHSAAWAGVAAILRTRAA